MKTRKFQCTLSTKKEVAANNSIWARWKLRLPLDFGIRQQLKAESLIQSMDQSY